MGFSRQKYWSGLPFPSLRIFLAQGLNLSLLHLLIGRQILYHSTTWEAHTGLWWMLNPMIVDEQHRFELCEFPYTWISFTKHILQYYTICCRLHQWRIMDIEVDCKVICGFSPAQRSVLLVPTLFKGQL